MKQLVNLDFTPEDVLRDFYPGDTSMFNILLQHSRQVCSKALALLDTAGGKFSANRDIVVYGAMLHDIGIGRCHASGIFCSGHEPYIRHGVIGGGMLREWGRKYGTDMEVFARICERHTGSGISAEEIVRQGLPLPAEDFFPADGALTKDVHTVVLGLAVDLHIIQTVGGSEVADNLQCREGLAVDRVGGLGEKLVPGRAHGTAGCRKDGGRRALRIVEVPLFGTGIGNQVLAVRTGVVGRIEYDLVGRLAVIGRTCLGTRIVILGRTHSCREYETHAGDDGITVNDGFKGINSTDVHNL